MMDPPEMHKLKTHSEQEVAYKPIIYKKKCICQDSKMIWPALQLPVG